MDRAERGAAAWPHPFLVSPSPKSHHTHAARVPAPVIGGQHLLRSASIFDLDSSLRLPDGLRAVFLSGKKGSGDIHAAFSFCLIVAWNLRSDTRCGENLILALTAALGFSLERPEDQGFQASLMNTGH